MESTQNKTKTINITYNLKTHKNLDLSLAYFLQLRMSEPTTNQELQNFVYEPPTSQEYQYKIYINDCHSYIGTQLVEHFRNDHIIEANPNIIIGSFSPNQPHPDSIPSTLPPGVNHLINPSNQRLLNSILIQADIVLFTLNQHNLQQFQYILKFLKNSTLPKQKRVICISSLLSWAKKSHHSPSSLTKDKLYLRNPLHYHTKTLEDLCLALSQQNQRLKGSVVFSGLVYGLGEDSLFPYFKKALQQQKPLEIYGKGTNLIPTIHLKDLSSIVSKIAFSPYVKGKNWHFACDSSKITQKQLIMCIAENLGNGSVIQKPIEDSFSKNNFHQFTLDLQITDKQQIPEWHCPQGLKKGIEFIVGQFNQYRGLKPNKIVIIGPPVSGKSTIAQILKKNYGLSIINIKNLIEDIKQDQTDFGKQIQTLLEQIKTQKVQEQRKIYEEMKKKKKGKGVQEFDPTKIVPRLPDEQLKKVIKWRLNFSDCLNKGYIMDSVIKSYKVAEGVFLNEDGTLNEKILPNSVFTIKSTDDQVKQRVKSLPAQKTQNTHWTEEHTVRRLQTYAKDNEEKPLRSFFEQKVDVKEVVFAYGDVSIFAQFVERNGPLGFKKELEEPAVVENQNQEGVIKAEQQVNGQDEEEEDLEEEKQVEEEFNLEKLTAKEQKILNEKSRPIRQYLIDNVIPEITEGLLQICKEVPEDPIDFLIGFLERKDKRKHR